jgi:tetratricopeptide (TPR) repeat protein
MSDSNVLFISHNAADRPYAAALETAIHELLDNDMLIEVRYSTSNEAGPQGGEKWREWIYRQVVEGRTAVIVVTPQALGRPWLLWEAGACWGAALVQKAAAEAATGHAEANGIGGPGRRLNVSISYGLTESECPDPLRGDQIIPGANVERMSYLLQRVLQVHDVPTRQLFKAGERIQAVLARYLQKVRASLLQSPSLVTEANVQDWLARLDELVRSNRLSELKSFQRWMILAFGRDGEAAGVPIDVRLHRRLGELYLREKEFARASEQLQLARRAAPRDIYVLRPLAEVSMKQLLADELTPQQKAAGDDVESLLSTMKELDDQAFVATPDAAALLGKYQRRVRSDPERAVETYKAALGANPDSYYLADLLAQTELDLGRHQDALVSFRQALAIVDRLGEHNVWSHATAATACLAAKDVDGARRHLAAIGKLGPTKSESDSIISGFRDVASRLGIAPTEVDQLLFVIVGQESVST